MKSLIGCFWAVGIALAQTPPALQSNLGDAPATAGFYNLQWLDASGAGFELQEADNAAFTGARTLYMGPNRASTLTGRPDGTYYYRLRVHEPQGTPGPWSAPVSVMVTHHPLSRAWLFFCIGAVTFLAALAVVARGAAQTDSEVTP